MAPAIREGAEKPFSGEERRAIRRRVVARMRRNPLPAEAPRFTREDIYDRGRYDCSVLRPDRRDERERLIAENPIESLDDAVLLWQVACECLWSSRRPESQNYSYSDASADIDELRSGWETDLPGWYVLDRAR